MSFGSWVSGLFGGGGSSGSLDPGAWQDDSTFSSPGTVQFDPANTAAPFSGISDTSLLSSLGSSGSSGTNWGKVAGALGDLAGTNKDKQQQQQQAQAPAVTGQAQSGGVGRPTTQVSLDALVRMLAERRNQYMQSAMSGHAAPVQQSNTRGLLGF
jgi:hypothetical protein